MKTLTSINPATKLLVAVAILFVASVASAQTSPAKTTDEPSASHKYFTDTELITQDGKTVRFYTDVLKGKVVVINCFFATCQGSCPVMSRTFSKLQQMLDERAVKDVVFVSITVDPELDTPERLKKYATTMGARPGWLLLTGTRANVDLIHKKLGQYVEEKADHNNIILIGNERTGLWKKAFGLAKPDELYAVLQSVVSDK
jgi:protein SCO1/2